MPLDLSLTNPPSADPLRSHIFVFVMFVFYVLRKQRKYGPSQPAVITGVPDVYSCGIRPCSWDCCNLHLKGRMFFLKAHCEVS